MATSPATQIATLRPDLRDALMEFDLQADQAGFVGLKIAPVIEVDTPAGQYPKIELKELLKNRTTNRASDGGYSRGDGKGTKDAYQTEEHGFEERVDEREATMFREWWDAELLAAERTRDAVLRNHNQRVIDLALAVANTTAAATPWTTVATATPIDNVRTAKLAVRSRCGVVPNVMVIDYDRLEYLKGCAQVIDRIKYSGIDDPKKVTLQMLAALFELEEVIVSGSVTNSANEAQVASIASMWTASNALLFVRAPEGSNDMKRPQFMRTFHWGADGSEIGGTFESYRDEARRSDIVRHRLETDEKVVYSDCAQRITGI